MKAAIPENEDERLRALYQLAILDSPREQSYDDIAQLAMMICDVPIAVVTLIDQDRQWFKTCLGLDGTETPRDVAFCAHAILTPNNVLEVEDATQDPRFSDNPLVTGAPFIRSYAGAPLLLKSGVALGTLCVVDYYPKRLTAQQKQSLVLLANQIVRLLELRENSQKLADQAKKLTEFYRMSPVAITLNRFADGLFLEANPALFQMLGYTPDEFAGLTYWDLTPHKYREEEQQQLQYLQQSGRYGPYEKHFVTKQGDWLPVLLNGVLIQGPDGEEQIWSIIQDISERKRIEQLKNEFVSTISHELRTPLTSISAALRMVLGGMLGEVPEKIHEMLSVAAKNSQRLTLLINDLLDMEKLLAGKMAFDLQPHSVSRLLAQAAQENKSFADQYAVTFNLRPLMKDLYIKVDSQRLQQVLSNFLSNAAKFSAKGSSVDLDAELQDGQIKIMVRDYGQGIPLEFQKRLFQKFSQADASDARQRGGTGLGLAISKELVERMGGRIGFTSQEQQGSCFFAIFPTCETRSINH
jgi:PAS domain S-box-containing protein